MSPPARVFVDITHAREQRAMVGITRTVRSLLAALDAQGPSLAVSFGAGRFHLSETAASDGSKPSRLSAALGAPQLRRVAAGLPLAVVDAGWQLAGRVALARTGGGAPGFRHGDWLLLADQCWNYPAWEGAAQARRAGARVVLVVYDLIPLLFPQFCEPLFTRVFARWLPRMLGQCDAVACISAATLDDLRTWAGAHGVALPPAVHFRLGSEVPRATAGSVRTAVESFFDATPVFSMVGSVEPRKDHAQVLDLFDRLWAAGKPCKLFVAGRPHPLSHEVAARLERHPRAWRELLFVQDASDAEIGLAYDRSRALLFPSRAEGFGLPIVEARTRACPVIARALPCIREIADGGTTLFEDDAQLAEVLGTAIVTPRPGVAAMPAFSWADSAAQLMARVGQALEASP